MLVIVAAGLRLEFTHATTSIVSIKAFGRPRMEAGEHEPTRRPYQGPELFVYGDIREITQAVGRHAKKDGGVFPSSRSAV